ncbi:uncharacterized protein LOC120351600 [Nilaparvata lugens]|uniref:uncharacterized protein LOC120351600 n=1 Tax=Nilaparvata lugens TaxID=108931 RepID=UPI00193D0133|nr:uncharacterized protein LOC120351600 [Nilaparvata lugens]
MGLLNQQTPKYMLVCTVYIVAGLGLTSTIIELVRQQYARSWRQLQALAEMLARLADDADRTPTKAGRDLIRAELRRAALALQDKAGWQQAVDRLVSDIKRTPPAPPPPVIQIVVYESSV